MDGKIGSEHWLLAIFVFLLPFQSLLSLPVAGVQLQIADLAFLLLIGVWSSRTLSRRRPLRFHWFHALLCTYLLAILLSTIASVDPSRSSIKFVGKLYLVLTAFLCFEIVKSLDPIRLMVFAWLAAAGIVLSLTLMGIVAFYSGVTDPFLNPVIHPIYGSLPAGYYPRVEGLFAYPSMFCNFLGITWMLAIACGLNGWVRERYLWVLGSLLLIVNAFTLTPGLGGIFLTTGILLWSVKAGRFSVPPRVYLMGGILVAVLFFAAASVTLFSYDPSNVKLPLTEGEVSASHRAIAWSTAFQTFLRFPILGKGPGMPVSEAMYRDPNGFNQILTDAHNTYLSVLAETGIAGFLTFFALVLTVIWGLLIRRKDSLRWIRFCLLLAVTDSVLYQGLTGSYEDARHLWVVFGIAAAISIGRIGSEEGTALDQPVLA